MTILQKTELALDKRFDPVRCRHHMNGEVVVLHCHHYASLYTQLADDVDMLDGKKLLADVAEDTFVDVLKNYYEDNGITKLEDRIAIGEQYYAAVGLGQMVVAMAGEESGEVELLHSHIDEGWIKKWGKRDKPVNFLTQGYISALFSAVFDKPARSYAVKEIASIISGAEKSKFNVIVL